MKELSKSRVQEFVRGLQQWTCSGTFVGYSPGLDSARCVEWLHECCSISLGKNDEGRAVFYVVAAPDAGSMFFGLLFGCGVDMGSDGQECQLLDGGRIMLQSIDDSAGMIRCWGHELLKDQRIVPGSLLLAGVESGSSELRIMLTRLCADAEMREQVVK